jgi:hypothetical protein
MNIYTALRKTFAQSKQDKKFNDRLYDSDIIQILYERINELEDRIKELELTVRK